ncbi:acyltransferase [Pseudonocardia sp. NPDC046786]|uniref:acyltransferase family protein n=1 Tax=Pseudonocardia sp. NPDC046786 TaxID=3155471 RepID=UPI0033FA176D
MTAADREPGRSTARLHGLDALRGGALVLGIILHSLMPFLPAGTWVPDDRHSSVTADTAVTVIHLFRMVLFMMLAGYFGRMVLHRVGVRAYLRDRGVRILLPLVIFGPVMLASVVAIYLVDGAGQRIAEDDDQSPWFLLLASPAHLWFLNVLLQCVAVTVVIRWLLIRGVGPTTVHTWCARAGNLLATPVLGVLLAALPYLGALLLQGHIEDGIEEPSTVLPEPVPLLVYLGAFVVGWCLQGGGTASTRVMRAWAWNLVAAMALSVAVLTVPDAVPLGIRAILVAVAGWTWALGLFGAGVRFVRRERAWIRYLADASYWMYLIHLPIVMVAGVLLADLTWPVLVKLVVVWTVCPVLLLGSYDLLVRNTWIGVWLNGRRRPSTLVACFRLPQSATRPRAAKKQRH